MSDDELAGELRLCAATSETSGRLDRESLANERLASGGNSSCSSETTSVSCDEGLESIRTVRPACPSSAAESESDNVNEDEQERQNCHNIQVEPVKVVPQSNGPSQESLLLSAGRLLIQEREQEQEQDEDSDRDGSRMKFESDRERDQAEEEDVDADEPRRRRLFARSESVREEVKVDCDGDELVEVDLNQRPKDDQLALAFGQLQQPRPSSSKLVSIANQRDPQRRARADSSNSSSSMYAAASLPSTSFRYCYTTAPGDNTVARSNGSMVQQQPAPPTPRMTINDTSSTHNQSGAVYSVMRGFGEVQPKLSFASKRMKQYFESLNRRGRRPTSKSAAYAHHRLYQFFKSTRTEFAACLLFTVILYQALISCKTLLLHNTATVSSQSNVNYEQLEAAALQLTRNLQAKASTRGPSDATAAATSLATNVDANRFVVRKQIDSNDYSDNNLLRLAQSANSRLYVHLIGGLVSSFTVATLTQVFGHISGCHLIPSVSLALYFKGHISRARLASYLGAQSLGSLTGVALLSLLTSSQTSPTSPVSLDLDDTESSGGAAGEGGARKQALEQAFMSLRQQQQQPKSALKDGGGATSARQRRQIAAVANRPDPMAPLIRNDFLGPTTAATDSLRSATTTDKQRQSSFELTSPKLLESIVNDGTSKGVRFKRQQRQRKRRKKRDSSEKDQMGPNEWPDAAAATSSDEFANATGSLQFAGSETILLSIMEQKEHELGARQQKQQQPLPPQQNQLEPSTPGMSSNDLSAHADVVEQSGALAGRRQQVLQRQQAGALFNTITPTESGTELLGAGNQLELPPRPAPLATQAAPLPDNDRVAMVKIEPSNGGGPAGAATFAAVGSSSGGGVVSSRGMNNTGSSGGGSRDTVGNAGGNNSQIDKIPTVPGLNYTGAPLAAPSSGASSLRVDAPSGSSSGDELANREQQLVASGLPPARHNSEQLAKVAPERVFSRQAANSNSTSAPHLSIRPTTAAYSRDELHLAGDDEIELPPSTTTAKTGAAPEGATSEHSNAAYQLTSNTTTTTTAAPTATGRPGLITEGGGTNAIRLKRKRRARRQFSPSANTTATLANSSASHSTSKLEEPLLSSQPAPPGSSTSSSSSSFAYSNLLGFALPDAIMSSDSMRKCVSEKYTQLLVSQGENNGTFHGDNKGPLSVSIDNNGGGRQQQRQRRQLIKQIEFGHCLTLSNGSQMFIFQLLATLLIVLTYLVNVDPRRTDLGYKSLSIGLAYFLAHTLTLNSGGFYANPVELLALTWFSSDSSLAGVASHERWRTEWLVYLVTPLIGGLFGAMSHEYIDFTSFRNRDKPQHLRRSFFSLNDLRIADYSGPGHDEPSQANKSAHCRRLASSTTAASCEPDDHQPTGLGPINVDHRNRNRNRNHNYHLYRRQDRSGVRPTTGRHLSSSNASSLNASSSSQEDARSLGAQSSVMTLHIGAEFDQHQTVDDVVAPAAPFKTTPAKAPASNASAASSSSSSSSSKASYSNHQKRLQANCPITSLPMSTVSAIGAGSRVANERPQSNRATRSQTVSSDLVLDSNFLISYAPHHKYLPLEAAPNQCRHGSPLACHPTTVEPGSSNCVANGVKHSKRSANGQFVCTSQLM